MAWNVRNIGPSVVQVLVGGEQVRIFPRKSIEMQDIPESVRYFTDPSRRLLEIREIPIKSSSHHAKAKTEVVVAGA